MEHQELLSGFIRLYVLHHAAEGDLYGQLMNVHSAVLITAAKKYPGVGFEQKEEFERALKNDEQSGWVQIYATGSRVSELRLR